MAYFSEWDTLGWDVCVCVQGPADGGFYSHPSIICMQVNFLVFVQFWLASLWPFRGTWWVL